MLYGRDCVDIPTVFDGIKCQQILDAILLSAEKQKTVDIK